MKSQNPVFFATVVILFLMAMISSTLSAQQVFTAKVVDEANSPVPMSVVAVIDSNNNELCSAISDSTGKFILTLPKAAQGQWLYVKAFGYHAYKERLAVAVKQSLIQLSPEAVRLGDVTIQSDQLSVERKADRYTISNIYTSPLAAGHNISDVLKYVPLINVDKDGELSILNKGHATIYINGRKSNINPKNIPAESIEKIEVISNPGSEYPSTDRNGIINIILKKSDADGVSASITITDSQREKGNLNNPDLSCFLALQKNKINASFSFSTSYYPKYFEQNKRYCYWNDSLMNVNRITSQSSNMSSDLNAMLDWHINDKHTLGFQLGFYTYKMFTDKASTICDYYRIGQDKLDSSSTTSSNLQPGKPKHFILANINYTIKFNSKQKLSFDIYYDKSGNNDSYLYQNSYSTDYQVYSYSTQNSSIVHGLDFKTKYNHSFTEDMQLNVGFECYGSVVDDSFFYGHKVRDEYVNDPSQSNDFNFKDITEAVFVDYDWEISDKWSLTAGLREEYYAYKGFQRTTQENISGSYPNIFPSLSVSFMPNDDHEISLDFTSGLINPAYYQRNPFKRYYSPTLYEANNVSLRPFKQYDLMLSYSLFWDYMIIFDYTFEKGVWCRFNIPEPGGITRISEYNFGNEHLLDVELQIDKQLFNDFLYLSFKAFFDWDIYKVTSTEVSSFNDHGFDYGLDLNINTALNKKKDWRFSLRFQYCPKSMFITSYSNENYYLSANVSKQFKHSTLSFGVNDILNWQSESHLESSSYSFYNTSYTFGRTYWISYSVNFGNSKTKGAQRRSSSIQSRL